jgi:non-ribosomal peptide synthetase component F
VLLYSYSGSKDLAVSFPKAGRTRRETEELIGFFVNLLVLRADLSETPTFRELLGRVRARTLEAYAHEDVPLHPLRLEPSVRNRVRVEFNLLNAAPRAACEINGVTIEPTNFEGIMNVRPEAEGGELDLELYMIEDGGALRGVWFRAVDRVDARVMGRMMRSWQRLLELVVANPDGKVEELRHRLLDDGTPDTSPLTRIDPPLLTKMDPPVRG